jgi:excisionase family DNA binding protein
MTNTADSRTEGRTELLSPEGLAELLGVSVATCYAWRYKGTGPRSIKVGKHLRYRRADVDAWLEANASPAA